MKNQRKTGGEKIEIVELDCLADVQVTKNNLSPLDDETLKTLEPLVKRALFIAADNVSSWLGDALFVDSAGITFMYHLVFSELSANPSNDVFKYVSKDEFERIKSEVDEIVANGDLI